MGAPILDHPDKRGHVMRKQGKQELVSICPKRPVRPAVNGIGDDQAGGSVLWRDALVAHAVAAVMDKSRRLQCVQQVVRAVRAIVGIDQNFVEADGMLVADPFENVWPLVLHCRKDKLHRRFPFACDCRSAAGAGCRQLSSAAAGSIPTCPHIRAT